MTAQVHERLIYEGRELSMTFCPPLPEGDPRLQVRPEDEMADCAPIIFSTACWRGYIATWEIKDGKFYLVDIEGRYTLATDAPILADWFSGVLRIPQGDILHYVHMGFASIYERELLVTVEKGVVVETRVVDNRGQNVGPSAEEWGSIF